jgi:superfamily II DNA or RNA helicase
LSSSKLKQKQHKAKIQIEEAIKQIGYEFAKRIKHFAKAQKLNGVGDGHTVKNIPLSELTSNFNYGQAYKQLSSHYQSKVPPPHICAKIQGLIKFERNGNKSYTYKLLRPKMKLRPYQADIVEQTSKAKGSVLVELPTGGGKSIIAKEIIKREVAQGGKVLIVAPKITLLEQLANTFDELNPQIIHGKKDYDKKHNVFVSTLQTAYKRDLGFTPTTILIDEVHFGFTGKMIKQLLDSFKGKLVGLSATPYDKQGKPLQGFDTHLNQYDIDYMISNGYLVPIISYQPIKVDLKGIRTTAGDYNIQDLDQKFNNIESVMQVVDATKQKIIDRNQTIVFCITIKHAEAVAKAYNEAGIKAMAIHSHLTKDEQAKALEAFKSGDIKVLISVDMATTGFDHPPADTIVLARATKSQNLYKQMVGRVLRLAPNKHNAVLLDCAGVISDLGLPTQKIRPKCKLDTIEANKSKCSECESTRVYRTIKDDVAYKVCAECGYREKIESQKVYECENCGQCYGNNAKFTAIEDKLYLECDCGYLTIVSQATTHSELKAIFDKELVEQIKRRVIATYCTYLIDKFGTSFIFSNEVKRQIQAIELSIEQYPEVATQATPQRIGKRVSLSPDKWRLIDKIKEDKLLPKDDTTEAVFYATKNFKDAVKHLNILLKRNGKPQLKEWVINKTMEQIKGSKVQGIEAMTVQRLKNLYSNKKDCNTIDTFVPYIEQQKVTF